MNGDGFVSPLDALIVINYLDDGNTSLPAELEDPPTFLDVSGDNQISPIDALIVVNFLNDPTPTGEAESAARRLIFAFPHAHRDDVGAARGNSRRFADLVRIWPTDEKVVTSTDRVTDVISL